MSVSSVGSSNQQAYLPSFLQRFGGGDSVPSADGALQALYQAYSDDPTSISSTSKSASSLSSEPSATEDSSTTTSSPRLSTDILSVLFSLQGGHGRSANTVVQSIFDKFDSDSDGAINQTELESAIGTDADKAKVDGLFNKLDTNGDGVVSRHELKPALKRVLGGHPLEALLSAARGDSTVDNGSGTGSGGSSDTGTATMGVGGLMADLNRLLQQLSSLSNSQFRNKSSTTNLTV